MPAALPFFSATIACPPRVPRAYPACPPRGFVKVAAGRYCIWMGVPIRIHYERCNDDDAIVHVRV